MTNQTRPAVTVIMATFNGEKYVEEQLASIATQTLPPAEVLISDDGSTDATVQIVERFISESTMPIRLIRRSQPLGFRNNFMEATSLAQGDLIAFSDQDDCWRADKLETCAESFKDPLVSTVAHTARTIGPTGDAIGHFDQGIKRTTVREPLTYDPWFSFAGFSMVFRRSLLNLSDNSKRFDSYLKAGVPVAHDRWITLLGQIVGRTVELPIPLVDYRQHDDNLFGVPGRKTSQVSLLDRSTRYINSTIQMQEVVTLLDADATQFPLFDPEATLRYIQRAVMHLEARHRIYKKPRSFTSAANMVRCAQSRRYRNIHDETIRWKSIARDLRFLVSGT